MAILDTPPLLKDWTLKHSVAVNPIPQRNKVLMVHPQHYKVAYAINPHMLGPDGRLKQIDSKKAIEQWKSLVKVFEKCGLEVEIMDSQEQFPDMVFAANQCFLFWNTKTHAPEAILSNMHHEERKGETYYFEEFFKSHEYKTHYLPKELSFEGTGDALIDCNRRIIFSAFGFRSHASIPSRLCELTDYATVPLKLSNPDFYHLDTCLAPLSAKDVVIVDDAFSDESLELIYAAFENVIHADPREARDSLAANLFCPNARDVILDCGNVKLRQELDALGYRVHLVDTSEFLKAGGSVFCLKLFLW